MPHQITDIAKTVKQFNDYLKGYIIKKVGDPILAEDLTQEVMYRLAKADGENQEIKNVKAWLFQTTRHVISDHYRARKKDPVVNVQEDLNSSSGTENFHFPDEFVSISDADFILPVIQLLPEAFSKPLIMSDIENIPQKEITKHLGLGLSATKMRIKRARQKLHDLFVECCEIEFDSRGDFAGCTIKDHCAPFLAIRNGLYDKTDCSDEM